jgi:hypothetical protein
MPTKQGYQYMMPHIRLFVFRKGMLGFLSAIILFLKLKFFQYCHCIMHAFKYAFRGIYS